jgi:hypothetical protein
MYHGSFVDAMMASPTDLPFVGHDAVAALEQILEFWTELAGGS